MAELSRWAESRSGPGYTPVADEDMPVMTDEPPLDLKQIRRSIAQATTERKSIPTRERIDVLTGRLRGHVGLLLKEELGPADADLKSITGDAELLLRTTPASETRRDRWSYAQALGFAGKGLLRRYEAAHQST